MTIGIKISQMTSVAALTGGDLIPIARGTNNNKFDLGTKIVAMDAATTAGLALKTNVADLAASGGAGLVGFLQSGTGAVSRTVQDKFRKDIPITPFDFGALSGGADDTAALAAMVTAVNALCNNASDSTLVASYPRVEFPDNCAGFRTTAGLILDANVRIYMRSPLFIVAAAGTATVGLYHKNFRAVDFQGSRDNDSLIDVRRVTQSNWASENDIGYKNDGIYCANMRIKRVDNFTVGANVCFGYGRLELGDIRNNKVGLIYGDRDAPVQKQFGNQCRIVGGSFVIDGVNAGLARYGIRVTNINGINTVRFDGQSYELNKTSAGVADSLPIVFDGSTNAITSVSFVNQRSEANGNTLVRAVGNVQASSVSFLDAQLEYSYPGSLFLDDQTTYGSVPVYRQNGAADPVWRPLFQTGALAKNALGVTGAVVTVVNMEAASNVGASPATQTFTALGSGATFNANGFMTAAGPLYGVRVALNGEREIAISGTKIVGDPVNMAFICYDSAGAQIRTDGSVRYGQSSVACTLGTYGGIFYAGIQPANSAPGFDEVISFASTVATVFVCVYSAVSQYTIKSKYGRAAWFSATSHLTDQFVANAVPVALTNVTYPVGLTAVNITPAVGAVKSWMLDTGATWRSTGNL
jgi:hypothetical protein